MEKKFYEFGQNNSGGKFIVTKTLCHRLIIEAENEKEATKKAIELEVYFDGVNLGLDCECCGDRWSGWIKEIILPYKFGDYVFNDIENYAQFIANEYGFTKPDVRIFYKDGKIKEIFTQENK